MNLQRLTALHERLMADSERLSREAATMEPADAAPLVTAAALALLAARATPPSMYEFRSAWRQAPAGMSSRDE